MIQHVKSANRLIRSSPKHPASSRQATCNTLGPLGELWLVEWDAKSLCRHRSCRAIIFSCLSTISKTLLTTLVLDPLLPILVFSSTPGGENEVVKFKVGDKVLPIGNLNLVIVTELNSLGKHIVLYLFQLLCNSVR